MMTAGSSGGPSVLMWQVLDVVSRLYVVLVCPCPCPWGQLALQPVVLRVRCLAPRQVRLAELAWPRLQLVLLLRPVVLVELC
jgi:hypothetical protein